MQIRRKIDANGVCHLIFDSPDASVNVVNPAALEEFDAHIGWIERNSELRGVALESAKSGNFIAGADLSLLASADGVAIEAFIARGQRVLNRLVRLRIPSVAMIRGICVAGGLEITLACDWRAAVDEPATQLGLPETRLGLLPAWGGSVRLPRLIGMKEALGIILSGQRIPAAEAARLGLVDAVTTAENLESIALGLLGSRRPLPRIRETAENLAELAAQAARENLAEERARQPALRKAVEVAMAAAFLDLEGGLALEKAALVQLAMSPEAQVLIGRFFEQQRLRKARSAASK